MASMEARLNVAARVLDSVCDKYAHDPDCQLLDLMSAAKNEMMKHGLASYQTVHSMKTVVHPRNRGNGMLEPSDVPEKVADISDVA